MIASSLLDSLKNVLIFNPRRIYIDNVFSRAHYVWTNIILVTFAILVTTKMYVGERISCMASPEVKDIVKQYCYIHSTFTRGRFEKGTWIYEPAKENEIYPGVRPGVTNDRVIVHSYYQWVWFVLTLQAVFFYFPHWVWEKLERGTTMMLVGDLNVPLLSNKKKKEQGQKILFYLKDNRGYHQQYALFYGLSELGNLLNIVVQLVATDYFLDNAFSTYGLHVFTLTQEMPYQRDDKLARIFPTVTACRLATGGVAFGKVQHDILCILPINILNEKIYIILWFWFVAAFFFTLIGLAYRLLTLYLPFRIFMMKRKVRKASQQKSCEHICENNAYGEWFLLYKLSQNMDAVTFGVLVDFIAKQLRKREKVPGEEIAMDEPLLYSFHKSAHDDTDNRYVLHSDSKSPKQPVSSPQKKEGVIIVNITESAQGT